MEKKELIRFIKNYFKEKGFNVSKRDFFGPLCVYERDDIYFIIGIHRSSYSDLQYFEYNYVIKGLYDYDIDEKLNELKEELLEIINQNKILDNELKLIFEEEF